MAEPPQAEPKQAEPPQAEPLQTGPPQAELQATVALPAGEQPGTVVLDDGSRLAYPAAAVQPQVRRLHPGQRVRLQVAGDPPVVLALTLVGLPLG